MKTESSEERLSVLEVSTADDRLTMVLEDGRAISVPLSFYPSLYYATSDERAAFEISGGSVTWEALDVDLDYVGLLRGAREHPLFAAKALARHRRRMAAQKKTSAVRKPVLQKLSGKHQS